MNTFCQALGECWRKEKAETVAKIDNQKHQISLVRRGFSYLQLDLQRCEHRHQQRRLRLVEGLTRRRAFQTFSA